LVSDRTQSLAEAPASRREAQLLMRASMLQSESGGGIATLHYRD